MPLRWLLAVRHGRRCFQGPDTPVSSTGQRNGTGERLRWCHPTHGLLSDRHVDALGPHALVATDGGWGEVVPPVPPPSLGSPFRRGLARRLGVGLGRRVRTALCLDHVGR